MAVIDMTATSMFNWSDIGMEMMIVLSITSVFVFARHSREAAMKARKHQAKLAKVEGTEITETAMEDARAMYSPEPSTIYSEGQSSEESDYDQEAEERDWECVRFRLGNLMKHLSEDSGDVSQEDADFAATFGRKFCGCQSEEDAVSEADVPWVLLENYGVFDAETGTWTTA